MTMVIKFLKKYFFIILAVLIGVGGYFYIRAVGNTYTHVRKDISSKNTIHKVYVEEGTRKSCADPLPCSGREHPDDVCFGSNSFINI